jgi:hypothetical protein
MKTIGRSALVKPWHVSYGERTSPIIPLASTEQINILIGGSCARGKDRLNNGVKPVATQRRVFEPKTFLSSGIASSDPSGLQTFP